MDERVRRALAKWPDVPAAYGWVALDRRGRWRLDGGLVRNRATTEAINRNYACDEKGRSYYQNGPQRAYVDLEYTPWIYVLDGGGVLRTHTGAEVERLEGAWLDDESNLLLESEHGIGVVSDVDLDAIVEHLTDAAERPLGDEGVERVLETACGGGPVGDVRFAWGGVTVPVRLIRREEVAACFGFVSRPVSPGSAKEV